MRVRLDEIYRIRGFIISPTSGFMDVWDCFLILGLIYTSVSPVSAKGIRNVLLKFYINRMDP